LNGAVRAPALNDSSQSILLKNSVYLGSETSASNFDLSDRSRIDDRDAGKGRSTPAKVAETVLNEFSTE